MFSRSRRSRTGRGASCPTALASREALGHVSREPGGGSEQGGLGPADRRQRAPGQGALPGNMSGLRGAHRLTERQERRVRVLQTLPSRRDRAEMDTTTGSRSNARMASALRRCAVLLRLVAHPRTPARRRSAQTSTSRRMARAVHRHRSVRELGGGARRRLRRRLNVSAVSTADHAHARTRLVVRERERRRRRERFCHSPAPVRLVAPSPVAAFPSSSVSVSPSRWS